MPIRPENLARYPKDWKTVIVPAVRARSGGRCECTGQCGLHHGAADEINQEPPRCRAINYEPHPTTGSKVVLTVMHLNHQPEDCRMENLLDGCQQCHNRYDAPMRRAGIQQRAHVLRAAGDLFEDGDKA